MYIDIDRALIADHGCFGDFVHTYTKKRWMLTSVLIFVQMRF